MYPPIFDVCAASPAVVGALGPDPVRLYPFGASLQLGDKPYAVWQVVGGAPDNFLAQRPDIDAYTLQVDCYAPVASAARSVAEALRDAIEPVAYVVSWRGEEKEPNTNLYRYSFDVDWLVKR